MAMADDDTDDQQSHTLEEETNEIKKTASLRIHLFQAAMKKDVKAFERALNNFLASDNDINSASSMSGNSLIHVAAKFGNGEIVRTIADHSDLRFLLTKTNSNGDTVWHIAVRTEDESVFNVLKDLSNDQADVESPTSGWKHLLSMARNNEGNTPLHEALIHRRHKMAVYLMHLVDHDVFFSTNKNKKSALYLSVEAGYLDCVEHMLGDVKDSIAVDKKLREGRSVIHAAVQRNHIEIVILLSERLPKLKYVKDEEGRSTLHLAASIGALKMTRYLLESRHGFGLDESDWKGMMPIHHAAKNNRVNVMKELLKHYDDPCELVTSTGGENILHVAAKFGRYNAVRFILESPELKNLLNHKDSSGNTPLHLASKMCRPRIVSALTWDGRLNVEIKNEEGLSALDVMGSSGSTRDEVFKKMLTWAALKAAKTPRFELPSLEVVDENPVETYRGRVDNLLLVSTLVVTVTFAAGFTMPGAYNSSDAHDGPGMAINLKHLAFQIFVICNTIGMYSAMLVVVILMWAQLGDFRMMRASLQIGIPLLGSSLCMMCIAFMTGCYVTVSRLRWLAIIILTSGCSFLAAIAGLFFLLGFPAHSNNRCIRFVTYYLILAMLWVTGNLSESRTHRD